MRYMLLALTLMATPAFAVPTVFDCNDGASGNIPQSAGWATTVTTGNANAVTQTTVPAGANRVIMGSFSNYAACERPSRCSTYNANASVGQGYLINPNGRYLPTAGGIISLTSPVTGTVIGLEYCRQK